MKEYLRRPYALATELDRRPLSASFDAHAAARQYDFLIVVTADAEYERR